MKSYKLTLALLLPIVSPNNSKCGMKEECKKAVTVLSTFAKDNPALPQYLGAIVGGAAIVASPVTSIISDWFREKQNNRIARRNVESLIVANQEIPTGLIFSEEETQQNESLIFCIKNNIAIPGKGMLFYGKPGNGKTSTIEYIAAKTGTAIMTVNPSDICKPIFGKILPAINLKACFDVAKNYQLQTKKSIIIFIDEIDFAGQARMSVSGLELKALAAELLLQTQLASKQRGVYLAAATNYYEYLDAALKRDGRFGYHIILENPDLQVIKDMILQEAGLAPKNSIASLAIGLPKASIIDAIKESSANMLRKHPIALSTFKSKQSETTKLYRKKYTDKEALLATIQQYSDAFTLELEAVFKKKNKNTTKPSETP